eukprot:15408804-Alexandrium_andersonii.AAC.1
MFAQNIRRHGDDQRDAAARKASPKASQPFVGLVFSIPTSSPGHARRRIAIHAPCWTPQTGRECGRMRAR